MARANKIIFFEHEDYMEGIFENGVSFLFDKEDFDFIKSTNWHINNAGYVQSNKYKMLHRNIMKDKLGVGCQVDHINRNRLDNRRKNLRIATHSENMKNKNKYKSNKSGHAGVAWHIVRGKWQVNISKNGKKFYIGLFDNLQDAVIARKNAEKKYEFKKDAR